MATVCSALTLAVLLISFFISSANGCADTQPPGSFSCAQQKGWGKCSQGWMTSGGYCAATCGRCQGGNTCSDKQPPGSFSCAQQKGWGKCSQGWLKSGGYCAATCGRCQGGGTPQQYVSPVATIGAVTYPTPAPSPTYYPNGAVFAQVPFRYEPRVGNPPLTRTGYYYLPSGWQNKALPVMLMFHGLAGFGGVGVGAVGVGIMGAGSVINFQQMAEKYRYIMVAPDSQTAAMTGWRVPLASQAPTPDVLHAQACLDYVMKLPGVRVDMNKVATSGVSNGGYMAAPVASRYSIYTFALNQLQGNKVRMWISTGVFDPQCRPGAVRSLADSFSQAYYLWPRITYNVNFLVGHTLQDPKERYDAINWWLGLGDWTAITPANQLDSIIRILPPTNDPSYMGPLKGAPYHARH